MKLNQQINIERQENGDYQISWDDSFTQSPVEIFAATSPAEAPGGKLVHSGVQGSVKIESLRQPERHYFHLVTDSGDGITYAERALAIPGGTNLRDFGGYLTEDGRQVEWGKFYRSGHLAISDKVHLDYLDRLDIKVNCDFRHARDFVESANTLPDNVKRLNCPVDAGSFATFFENLREDQHNEAAMIEAMCDVNRQIVRNYQSEYRKMFAALLDNEEGGFLVNCTAGKDRTGFASALILYTLGVPKETIIYDYLLSMRYFKLPQTKKGAAMLSKYSAKALAILKSDFVKPLREVRGEYLQAAFECMEGASGSVDQFLEDAYGVGAHERTLLRERYTT